MESDGALIWTLGKIVIALSILLCMLANTMWVIYEKQSLIFEVLNWPQKSAQRVSLTYLYLSMSLLLTSVSKAYVFQSPSVMHFMVLHPNLIVILTVAAMTVFTTLLETVPYSKEYTLMKSSTWLLHSVAMGPTLAYFGSYICNISALSTVFALFLASAAAYLAPKDFYLKLDSCLSSLYVAVSFSSVLCILFNPPVTPLGIFCITLNFFGGMILYFGVFIVNTQYFLNEVKTNEEFDPVYTACVMFLCALNLYLRIAMYYVVELTNLTDPTAVITANS